MVSRIRPIFTIFFFPLLYFSTDGAFVYIKNIGDFFFRVSTSPKSLNSITSSKIQMFVCFSHISILSMSCASNKNFQQPNQNTSIKKEKGQKRGQSPFLC